MWNRITRVFAKGRSVMLVAAGWNVLDALLHVAVGMVEPLRISGNLVVVAGTVAVHLVRSSRLAAAIAAAAAGLVIVLNAVFGVLEGGLQGPAIVLILVSLALLARAALRYRREPEPPDEPTWWERRWIPIGATATAFVVILGLVVADGFGLVPQPFERQLHNDELVAADYWSDELVILSAGMGFDNIIGVPDDDLETVRNAGGTYYAEPACVEPHDPMTSTFPPATISRGYRGYADYDDGLPVVFSWPVLTSAVHPEDFVFTLNTGEQVVPHSAGMVPNWELNERNVIVVFGDFGNRGRADEPDAVFPVSVEIVDDGTPLVFLGPDGEQSGVGLTWETDATPYDSGPRLVGAKLNHVGEEPKGEGGFGLLERTLLPNDEFALYGGGDFRLRVLTTGGFSPDGLTGVTPDQYEDFFRIHATSNDGSTILLTEVDVHYEVAGGTLRVVGLADLGQPAGDGVHYDDCYQEDADNYIDIILEGDEAAARSITHVEIPAQGDYLPFYNPGGPGPEPFGGIRYTAPGPPDLEPVIIALDDPMRVDRAAP